MLAFSEQGSMIAKVYLTEKQPEQKSSQAAEVYIKIIITWKSC